MNLKNNLKFLTLFFGLSVIAQTELKFNLATSLVLVPNIGIEVPLNETIGYQLDTTA